MRVPGITNADMSRLINKTLEFPEWEYDGQSGTTHGILRHVPTGQIVRFGLTPRGGSWKTVASNIEKIGGRRPWKQGNRKRSRQNTTVTDPLDVTRAARAQQKWHDEHDVEIEAALVSRQRAFAEPCAMADPGSHRSLPTRLRLARQINAAEATLSRLGQHVDPLDPFDPEAA